MKASSKRSREGRGRKGGGGGGQLSLRRLLPLLLLPSSWTGTTLNQSPLQCPQPPTSHQPHLFLVTFRNLANISLIRTCTQCATHPYPQFARSGVSALKPDLCTSLRQKQLIASSPPRSLCVMFCSRFAIVKNFSRIKDHTSYSVQLWVC